MSDNNQGLETLEIWKKSLDYVVDLIQNILPQLPSEEKWALTSQLRRSAQSIPANIAEGYGRYHFKETIRFCYIARGSMAETKTYLVLAQRLGYIDEVTGEQYLARLIELGKMLQGYIRHLQKQVRQYSISESTEGDTLYDI